jgi:molecular chaperone DnaK (HSP70)
VPAGNVITTTFSLDVNGILHVSSREKRTGLEAQITIDNATARFESDELAAARERLSALIDGDALDEGPEDVESATPDAAGERRETVAARALVEKAERLLEGANPEDRDDLVNGIEAVRDALGQDDAAALEQAADQLADLIYYLES